MAEVAIEVALVTEHKSGIATLALNQDLLDSLSKDEQEKAVRSLFILARQKISEDLQKVPNEKLVPVSIDAQHNDLVMQLKLLLAPDGSFVLLTYFGGEVNPQLSLRKCLSHALEVVATVENSTFA